MFQNRGLNRFEMGEVQILVTVAEILRGERRGAFSTALIGL